VPASASAAASIGGAVQCGPRPRAERLRELLDGARRRLDHNIAGQRLDVGGLGERFAGRCDVIQRGERRGVGIRRVVARKTGERHRLAGTAKAIRDGRRHQAAPGARLRRCDDEYGHLRHLSGIGEV
jgi:hypothetical protein